MQIFSSLTQARASLPDHKKWTRLFAAISAGAEQPAGVMFSVVDSLTWFKFVAGSGVIPPFSAASAPGVFTASRRYFHVLYVISRAVRVDFADVNSPSLTTVRAYSDLDDREFFAAPAGYTEITSESEIASTEVTAGQLAVFEVSEALRFTPLPQAEGVLFRVTVEGATFANK